MKPKIYVEAERIWNRLSQGASEEELKSDLEIYRGLLNFFQVGDYYYYIFNVKHAAFDFISKDITRILGYHPEEMDVPFLMNRIHEDDQPYFLNFERKVTEFFATLSLQQIPNYKVRYDYRIQKKDGTYIRVLQQVVTIHHDDDRHILRTFGVHTDITHLKSEGTPVLSFIGLNGEPSYVNVDVKKHFSTSAVLTQRELEILQLLVEGKSSAAIGNALFISKLTVDTHRRNLLRKTGCLNTTALTSEAIKRGWI